MSSTAELLEGVSGSIEAELRPHLGGPFGSLMRAYLPQTWVFRTELGVASLVVGRDGHIAVVEGAAPNPDVTVEAGHERLKAALTTRRRTGLPPGPTTTTPHTEKGRTAFDFLRSRLGL